ncbi:MAG: TauD/TfdA family dioxygenase [Pseudomonadales bacterium]|nr:TauD/TfdA family dioxygenase [Pseudomonadales bacterium]
MNISSITPTVGAEVTGVDLADLSPEAVSSIKAAFLKHHVLMFRDQTLSRDQHKAFGRLFGDLHIHPSKRNGMNQQDPELFIINTKPDAKLTNGEAWHSDVSCEEIPPKASILYVTKCPENGGGDTMFANMHEAFDELSPALQSLLLSKTAYHDGEIDLRNYGVRLRDGQTYPKASHPLVPRHPENGRPYLFANGSFTSHIEGIPRWESDMLLQGLYQRTATNPRIQCRVKWQPNTLVMWDNRSVQHHAILDYAGFARYGERVSVLDSERPQPFTP